MSDSKNKISWKIKVPMFKNSIILKQLGFAIGLPFGLVATFIWFTSGYSSDTFYAIGLIASVVFLTFIIVLIVYRGNYEVEFILDEKGAICQTQANQMRKSRIINIFAILLGILSGKPSVIGAGMLAQSKQKTFIRWKQVNKVKFKENSCTIILKTDWMEQMVLFCLIENYSDVSEFVSKHSKH